ncbi:MAG: serine hydrolase domain-containing protein [Bacteroidota bacterium]
MEEPFKKAYLQLTKALLVLPHKYIDRYWVGLAVSIWPFIFAHGQDNQASINTIAELTSAIEQVMRETQTPAVGVALINADGTDWVAGLGQADIENDVAADEQTMFRIGSVSKMFVSLAILKLQEQGLVSLKDTVKNIVPEVSFENPYADTSPILVEHLLEHTTGWNDLHIAEFALNAEGMTLKAGLEYHPNSRVSRWVPGTRMAYCNSGPAVAAYIVEKVTGQGYESYIQENFFSPLGMANATFYNSETYQQLGAKLYADGQPQEYWHIIMRPSGAINASPKEMANFVRLFTHRGRVDTLQLMNQASLVRMETPSSTDAAQAGLAYGHGLSNQSSVFGSFVYRRHLGGVANGLCDFSYLPEHQVGYAFMTTSGSLEALERITELIRSFQTKDLPQPDRQIRKSSTNAADIEGYYIPINPRFDLFYLVDRLVGVAWIESEDQTFFKQGLMSEREDFVATDEQIFVSPETGKVSMVLVDDPLAGEVLHIAEQVFKRTSPLVVYGLWILVVLWILLTISSLVLGIVWGIRYWTGHISGGANTQIRGWVLLPGLLMAGLIVLVAFGMSDFFQAFGTLGFISISLFVITISFALASVWAVVYAIKNYRKPINRAVYWYSISLTSLHFFMTCYFLWHGIIGVTTWT